MSSIIYILNYSVIVETSLAAMLVFILFTYNRNRNANIFLAFYIILNSMYYIPFCLAENKFLGIAYFFGLISMPGKSIAGVFIYYYTRFMTERKTGLNKKDSLHFLIFFVFIIIYIIFFKPVIPARPAFPLKLPLIILIMMGCGMVNTFVYIAISVSKIKKYSRDIEYYFSNTRGIDLKWLTKIVFVPAVFSLIEAVVAWVTYLEMPIYIIIAIISILLFIIVLFILLFYIINQPEVLINNLEMHSFLENLNIENGKHVLKGKYANINLDIHTQEWYLRLLNEYMEKHKPYLNEYLTIKELSKEIDLPYYQISVVINNMLKKNFYHYINEYRIREVIDILNNMRNEDINILTVAFKCGFNSKSSFNRVFKQITGVTPSAYRKNNINSRIS